MDTNTIAMIILFATFMIFMVLRVPVTFSMLGACVLTALYLGPKYVSSVFLRLGDGVQSFSFLAIPFFIFAGDIMAEGGISDRLVEVANVMVGRFRGGLAYVNVIASTFFGGISGSPTADVSSLGPIEIGMMTKSGYDKDFSVATTVATATQALIIPPSHNMIIWYGSRRTFYRKTVFGRYRTWTYVMCCNVYPGSTYYQKKRLSKRT